MVTVEQPAAPVCLREIDVDGLIGVDIRLVLVRVFTTTRCTRTLFEGECSADACCVPCSRLKFDEQHSELTQHRVQILAFLAYLLHIILKIKTCWSMNHVA